MPDWDIDPDGVRGVLERVAESAGGMAFWGDMYQQRMHDAALHAGTLSMGGEAVQTGIVGAALAEFAEATGADLTFIAARISASTNGATAATTAYVNGDLAMAEDQQRAALGAPDIAAFLAEAQAAAAAAAAGGEG